MKVKKPKPKTYYIDTQPENRCVIVKERGTDIPVAKFKHGITGNQPVIATLTAIIHSLTLTDRSAEIQRSGYLTRMITYCINEVTRISRHISRTITVSWCYASAEFVGERR